MFTFKFRKSLIACKHIYIIPVLFYAIKVLKLRITTRLNFCFSHWHIRARFRIYHYLVFNYSGYCGSTSLKFGSVSISVFFVRRYCNYCAILPSMLGEPAACLSEHLRSPLRVLSSVAFCRVVGIYLIVDEKCGWQFEILGLWNSISCILRALLSKIYRFEIPFWNLGLWNGISCILRIFLSKIYTFEIPFLTLYLVKKCFRTFRGGGHGQYRIRRSQ